MSDAALVKRDARIGWARPGGAHDRTVRLARVVLPSAIGALVAVLVVAPLTKRSEISFILNKDKVDVANERMRVNEALYRGRDAKGRPFSLRAGAAVQKSSQDPVVELSDLAARIALDDGPAVLRTASASYDMDKEFVTVPGALLFESADGYRLATRGVSVDLKTQRLTSDRQVEGRMPLGTFRGGRMRADLSARTVTLEGGARLQIVQRARR
ncbi:MAG: LPS export ABC transporter periplasmic protein LptC [Sphingomonadaceae bacterium]